MNVQPTLDAFNDKHEATFEELAEAQGKTPTRGNALRFARRLRKYCGIVPRRGFRNGKRVRLWARCHFERYAKAQAPLSTSKDPYAKTHGQLIRENAGLKVQLAYVERELKARTDADALLAQVKAVLASLGSPLAKA